MRICVVGCGAVGSLFAANLATLDDVEVWAFDLNQAHVDAIKKNGLRLIGRGRGPRPAQRDDRRARELPPCDFGIVATKAMHAGRRRSPRPRTPSRTARVASVMNGVGNEETLAAHVERVIRGTTFPAGKLLEPGVVQWDVKGDTTFGPFEPRPRRRRGDRAARRRVHAGRDAGQAVADARPRAVAQGHLQRGHEPDRRADRPHARPRLRAARPARARLRARRRGQGGRRPRRGSCSTPIPEELIDHAARPDVAYGHKASMLQDVEARRPTEIDYLNGGIARFGRELGVPTPLHDAVAALIKGVEASWQQS